MTVSAAPDGGWGWVVVFASFMIHLIADGMVYTFGIFYVELLHHFGESRSSTSLVVSIMVGTTFCIGPLASGLTNKFGCRVVSIAGALLASLGLFFSAFAPRLEYLFLTTGLLAGSGLGLMCVPSIVSVSCYFERRRATATGLAVCGSGLGTFVMAPLADALVQNYGWQGALVVVAGLMLNCVVFSALYRPLDEPIFTSALDDVALLRRASCVNECAGLSPAGDDFVVTCTLSSNSLDRSSAGAAPAFNPGRRQSEVVTVGRLVLCRRNTVGGVACALGPRSPSQPGLLYHRDILYGGSLARIPDVPAEDIRDISLSTKSPRSRPREFRDACSGMLDGSLLGDPLFLLFALSNFLLSVGCNVPYVYTTDRVEEMGIASKEEASLLLSVIGVSNTVGRVVVCYWSDRWSVNRLLCYILCLLVNGLATALSALAADYYLMAAYCAVFGATTGACISLTSIILVELLGMEKLTNAFGLLLLFVGVSSFIGPPLTGWLYELSGSYNPGFCLSGAVIALSGAILFVVPVIQRTSCRKSLQ